MTPDRERVQAALRRMKLEGKRQFNEQLARIQEETGSEAGDIIKDLRDLGLGDEAKAYNAYLETQRAIAARREAQRRARQTPEFVTAENELASHLRDSTVNNNLPWIGVTDLHNIAQDLLMRGWTKAPTNTTQEES